MNLHWLVRQNEDMKNKYRLCVERKEEEWRERERERHTYTLTSYAEDVANRDGRWNSLNCLCLIRSRRAGADKESCWSIISTTRVHSVDDRDAVSGNETDQHRERDTHFRPFCPVSFRLVPARIKGDSTQQGCECWPPRVLLVPGKWETWSDAQSFPNDIPVVYWSGPQRPGPTGANTKHPYDPYDIFYVYVCVIYGIEMNCITWDDNVLFMCLALFAGCPQPNWPFPLGVDNP